MDAKIGDELQRKELNELLEREGLELKPNLARKLLRDGDMTKVTLALARCVSRRRRRVECVPTVTASGEGVLCVPNPDVARVCVRAWQMCRAGPKTFHFYLFSDYLCYTGKMFAGLPSQAIMELSKARV
jgi:hypothetical protein